MEAFLTSDLIKWLMGSAIAIIAWFVRGVMDKAAELEKTVATLHEVFMKRDDFRDFKTDLWKRLDKLEDAIKRYEK